MKKFFLIILILITVEATAQWPGTFYVAAKNGLSLREKKDPNSKVLVKIPYGTKISVSYTDETVVVSSEGMDGQWATTTFAGKTGFVSNSYLLPWAPPKNTVKTMKQYLSQVSAIAGAPLIIKAGNLSLEGGGSSMKKQVFKNGAEYHEETFYEANNDIYFLPGHSLEQGFVLIRLIPEFKSVFGADEEFPLETKKFTKDGREYNITVDKEKLFGSELLMKIKVEYEEGAYYTFEMFVLGGQLVISFGGGV